MTTPIPDTRLQAHSGAPPAIVLERVIAAMLNGDPLVKAVAGHCPDPAVATTVAEQARAISASYLWPVARGLAVRLRTTHWYLHVLATLAHHSGEVPVDTRRSLGRREFLEAYYYKNRAVYLPRFADTWPAVTRWGWSYLRAVCGAAVVEVMVNRDSVRREQQNTSVHLRRRMPWPAYVDMVFGGEMGNDYYIVSRNHFFDNPEMAALLQDLGSSDLVETRTTGRAVRMWFGPKGTLTPWHHDDRNNMIIQLVGRKRVALAPPCFAELGRQTMPWYAGDAPPPDSGLAGQTLDSVSTTVTLKPGDALFIPAGWWHDVESLDPSVTLACVDFRVPNLYEQPFWLGLQGLLDGGEPTAT